MSPECLTRPAKVKVAGWNDDLHFLLSTQMRRLCQTSIDSRLAYTSIGIKTRSLDDPRAAELLVSLEFDCFASLSNLAASPAQQKMAGRVSDDLLADFSRSLIISSFLRPPSSRQPIKFV